VHLTRRRNGVGRISTVVALLCASFLVAAGQASALSPTGVPVSVEARSVPPSAGAGAPPATISRAPRLQVGYVAPPQAPVQVYVGNQSFQPGSGDETFYELEAATGREFEDRTQLPETPSEAACVMLQLNAEPFDAGQVADLQGYMNQGGVVVGIGEYYNYGGADDTLNDLAGALGVGMSLQDNIYDSDFHLTTDIGPSPYAAGVSSLTYAATSGLNVSAPAQVIASTAGGEAPFLASQGIGSGAFVLVGDTNVLSDWSGGGYQTADNGVLAANLCGGGSGAGSGWPAGGLGYSFPNRGMINYAAGAGLAVGDILRPNQLSQTFADWHSNAVLAGDLPGAPPRMTLLQYFWQVMYNGTCYGLALSGGRFADGAEALSAPGEGRTDSTWNVGSSGPSATLLLPEPEFAQPLEYKRQFLGLDANDFLTQFSVEVLGSERAQRRRYAAAGGVAALRAQLESVMQSGTDLYDGTGRLSTPGGAGYALLTLNAEDPPIGAHQEIYGHAVLVYGLRILADGTLKIFIWDNNFPRKHYYVLVHPDGVWEYHDAPYSYDDYGHLDFGNDYSLAGAAGYTPGFLSVLPLYSPRGLHLFPGAGSGSSIVDLGSGTDMLGATAGNGSEPVSVPTMAGPEYSGQSVEVESTEGEIELGGEDPEGNVRGAGVFMSLAAEGPTTMSENTATGTIAGTGATTRELEVARNDTVASGLGAEALSVGGDGSVRATAGPLGGLTLTVEDEAEGAGRSATLFDGTAAPGSQVSFTASQVEAALAGAGLPVGGGAPVGGGPPVAGGGGITPGAGGSAVDATISTGRQGSATGVSGAHASHATPRKCHKGSRLTKVKGKAKCVKAKKGRNRSRHGHGRSSGHGRKSS
jgi:hypothetical protein